MEYEIYKAADERITRSTNTEVLSKTPNQVIISKFPMLNFIKMNNKTEMVSRQAAFKLGSLIVRIRPFQLGRMYQL